MNAWIIGILVAMVVALAIDLALSRKQTEAYFSSGIRIFRQELLAHSPNPMAPSAQSMENDCGKAAFSRLKFHRLDDETLGFQEADPGAAPVLRGLLRFHRAGARVEVTGFVGWPLPLLLAMMAITSFEFQEWLFFAGMAAVFVLLGAHKIQRCRQVAAAALHQWNA